VKHQTLLSGVEHQIEPTIESIVRPTQPNVLSGVSYLDEIFFKRK
jgi:hypothetical protein